MQSCYAEETDNVRDIATEELDLDGFFEDDIAPQPSTFNQGNGTEEAVYDASAGLDDSISFGSRVYNTSLETRTGFDTACGSQWIYPSNLPTRSYQYNIVQKALFTNTLVTLPTGLGKTFIAAVVMYNFYRWYPSGKVIFLAPTKPLVAQQVKACYNIMGIPKEHTTEMTGSLAPEKRVEEWKRKRVFFLTPQVMQNDLTRSSCPAEQVVCVVFDEAHKALGNHAYCQVIKGLAAVSNQFRVLALTATPGDDLKAIQQVLTNLMISHIELRSEESIDVRPYVHQRKVEKVVVSLDGEIKEIRTAFLKILARIVNRLVNHKVLYAIDADKLSRYQLLQARDKFRSNPDLQGRVPVGSVEGDFAVSITLYHAFELLQVHGMRSFYQTLSQFLDGPPSRGRSEITNDVQFSNMLRRLRGKLEEVDSIDSSSGVDSRTPLSQMYAHNVGHSFFYSHPKLRKLEEIVLAHFRNGSSSSSPIQTTFSPSGGLQKDSVAQRDTTRIMIFSQYRDSVKEIATMLSRHFPLVKAMSFVGQASSGKSTKGLTQKEQLQVVAKFRNGDYNTLVATCVGEEGLDIGDVDLIICFDAHNSPVRLIQRMGRTGRKRSGQIVVLVTEGKEDRVYRQSQSNKKSIHRTIKDGCKSLQFYGNSYRMIPAGLHPQVCHLHMHVAEETTPKKATKSSVEHGKGKQSRLSFGLYQGSIPGTLKDTELLVWKERYALSDRQTHNLQQAVATCIKPDKLLCLQEQSEVADTSMSSDSAECSSTTSDIQLSLDRWTEWQRASVSTRHIGHSSTTNQLVRILQFTESATVTPDFIMSYDMEMQMFLNHDDIVPSSSKQHRNEEAAISSSSVPTNGNKPGDKILKTGKRRLCFDSEDEDFVTASSTKREAAVMRTSVASSSKPSFMDVSIVNDLADSTSADSEDVPAIADNSSIIPPPPNVDSLSWMDQLPLSQSPNRTVTPLPLNYSTPVKASLKTTAKGFSPAKVPNKDKSPLQLPHLVTPVGQPSRSSKVSDNKLLSSKQNTPTILKGNKTSTPKLVATVRPSSQSVSHDKVATPTKPTSSPKQVSLVGTPYLEKHSDSAKATNQTSKPPLLQKKKRHPSDASVSLVAQANILRTPPNTQKVKPTISKGRHAVALNSPSGQSPLGVVESPGKFDDVIDTIPESDMECEEAPIIIGGSDIRKSRSEQDSFAVIHNKKKKNQEPSFLCTQLPSAMSQPRRKQLVIDSSTDDDFTPVKKKRKLDNHSSTDTSRAEGEDYLDLEAEVSSSDVTMTEDNVEKFTDKDAYDIDDSFINDATQLTQLPSKSPVNMQAIYKQSLISPNDVMFAGKQTGHDTKYRMKISRDHKLLHHFMGQAGIKVRPSDQSHSEIANDSFTGSEAEEEFLPLSQEWDDIVDNDVTENDIIKVTPVKPSNRRAVIMSPESVSPPPSRHRTAHSIPPKKVLFSPKKKALVAPSSSSNDVIVSPSLILTPPAGTNFTSPQLARFSLGMEEWMSSGSSVDRFDQHGSSRHHQCVINDSPKLLSSQEKLNSSQSLITVLVDSKEISNPQEVGGAPMQELPLLSLRLNQIVNLLRQKHHIKVVICQLGYVNYIVSNQTALQRLMVSDLCTTTGVRKAATELSKVREMYEKIYVLVEKDSEKKSDPSSIKMGYFNHAIIQLSQVGGVTLLFSQSPEESAVLINKVTTSEHSCGLGINAPVEMDSMRQKVHQLLFAQPHMNYTIALSLCHHYNTLHEIINCSSKDLLAKVPFINSSRAAEICNFFRRKFNRDLT